MHGRLLHFLLLLLHQSEQVRLLRLGLVLVKALLTIIIIEVGRGGLRPLAVVGFGVVVELAVEVVRLEVLVVLVPTVLPKVVPRILFLVLLVAPELVLFPLIEGVRSLCLFHVLFFGLVDDVHQIIHFLLLCLLLAGVT